MGDNSVDLVVLGGWLSALLTPLVDLRLDKYVNMKSAYTAQVNCCFGLITSFDDMGNRR